MNPLHKIFFRIRISLRWLWIITLWVSGQMWRYKKKCRDAGIVVLTLHRVLRDDQLEQTSSLPGMVVRQTTFDSLLAYLSKNCGVIDLDHPVVTRAKPNVAVTFDDGWSDTADTAFAALQKHRIPAAVFICPELVDKNLPFWPERVVAHAKRSMPHISSGEGLLPNQWAEQLVEGLKRVPSNLRTQQLEKMYSAPLAGTLDEDCRDKTMSWKQIEQLNAHGITLGSHTLSHQLLLTVPLAIAEHEIQESRRVLESRLKSECLLFAYPNGDASQELATITRAAGYKTAFINQPGIWLKSTDPMLVPRVNVWEGSLVSPWGTFSKLAFEYSVFRAAARAAKSSDAADRGTRGFDPHHRY